MQVLGGASEAEGEAEASLAAFESELGEEITKPPSIRVSTSKPEPAPINTSLKCGKFLILFSTWLSS